MLGWAISFVIAAAIVAALGLSGAVHTVAVTAKVLFWVFLIGFVSSIVMHFSRRHT
jgi:uncharacterized membrane protein YtjA (UPF0391 family)